MNIVQKGLLIVALPLIVQLAFVGTLYYFLKQGDEALERELRSKAIMRTVERFCLASLNAYLFREMHFWMGMPEMEDRARGYIVEQGKLARQIKEQVKNDPDQFQRAQFVEKASRKIEQLLLGELNEPTVKRGRTINTSDPIQQAGVRYWCTSFLRMMNANDELLEAETGNAYKNEQERMQARKQLLLTIPAGVGISAVLAIVMAVYYNRSTASRLSLVYDNTRRLADGRSLLPVIAGKDEIASIDSSFHKMADILTANQKRLVDIFDNMLVGLLAVEAATGKIEFTNPQLENILGVSVRELVGKQASVVFPDDPYFAKGDYTALLNDFPQGQVMSVQAKTADGSMRDLELSVSRLENEAGLRLLFCAEDVTAQREVERIKQQFVSMVIHELRTPLTSVRVFFELMHAGVYKNASEEQMQERSLAQTHNIQRLINLINDLLQIEKMDQGKMDLSVEEIQLKSLVSLSIESVMGVAAQKNITVESTDVDHALVADPDRVVQVIVNFLSNAVKFSPEGSTITVAGSGDQNWVTVKVIDRGRGIPAEHCNAVFEKFHQVNTKDAVEKSGTGLGLAICKSIIESHDGTIGVESEVGKGSTFWFRLPKQGPADKMGAT